MEKFTRGGNPYKKLNIGDDQLIPMGDRPYKKNFTYAEYLREQRNKLNDIMNVLRNDVYDAMPDNGPKDNPKWFGNVESFIRDARDGLENAADVLDTYSRSGMRLEE